MQSFSGPCTLVRYTYIQVFSSEIARCNPGSLKYTNNPWGAKFKCVLPLKKPMPVTFSLTLSLPLSLCPNFSHTLSAVYLSGHPTPFQSPPMFFSWIVVFCVLLQVSLIWAKAFPLETIEGSEWCAVHRMTAPISSAAAWGECRPLRLLSLQRFVER